MKCTLQKLDKCPIYLEESVRHSHHLRFGVLLASLALGNLGSAERSAAQEQQPEPPAEDDFEIDEEEEVSSSGEAPPPEGSNSEGFSSEDSTSKTQPPETSTPEKGANNPNPGDETQSPASTTAGKAKPPPSEAANSNASRDANIEVQKRDFKGDTVTTNFPKKADKSEETEKPWYAQLGLDKLTLLGFVQADGVLWSQESVDEIDPSTGEPLNNTRFLISSRTPCFSSR